MSLRVLPSRPSLAASYLRAVPLPQSLPLLGGRAASPAESFSSDRLAVRDLVVDRTELANYQTVCGFRVCDELPPTFAHVLAFPLAMKLMTGRDFPFPLLGLVHVHNTIVQHRALRAEEPLTLEVWADNLRPHRTGRQLDVHTVAIIGDEVVWEETSTYLRREAGASEARERVPGDGTTAAGAGGDSSSAVIRWRVPSDIGRRYAAVSGDRNPIHLNGLTAKAFGFRTAIAHGMWLAARTLAAMGPRLPRAFTADFSFKTPVFLPATLELAAVGTGGTAGHEWDLEVHTVSTGKPNLTGAITALP